MVDEGRVLILYLPLGKCSMVPAIVMLAGGHVAGRRIVQYLISLQRHEIPEEALPDAVRVSEHKSSETDRNWKRLPSLKYHEISPEFLNDSIAVTRPTYVIYQ